MKKSIYLIIALLVIFNIYTSVRYYRLKKEAMNVADKYSSIQIKEERNSQKLKTYALFQQTLEGISVPSLKVQNSQKEIMYLSEIETATNKPVLCFRFKDTHCDACVQQAVRILNEISSLIPDKIVLLSGYRNFAHFAAFESCQKEKISTYNVKDIPDWEIDTLDQSYFFVLYDNRIHNVFIPLKEDKNYTVEYIHTLLHKYWEESSCSEECQLNGMHS